MWESLLGKIGLDALKAGIKAAKKEVSKKEYTELISEAIRELLKLHPNITAAEAKLLAAEALSLPDSADMLAAREILGTVKDGRKRIAKKKVKKRARKIPKKKAKKKAKIVAKKKVKKKIKRVAKKKAKRSAKKRAMQKARK